MKKIIGGKRYDTDTATKLGTWDNNYGVTDFHYCEETLYQKKTGEFFLHGSGNAASKYAEPVGSNSWSGGKRLMPMSFKEAQQWAEEHLSADEYESIFGEVAEDDSKVTITLSLPKSAAEKLKRLASQTEKTQSEIIADMIKDA